MLARLNQSNNVTRSTKVNPYNLTYEKIAILGYQSGMQKDQLSAFFRSNSYMPQPKQMEFHAACRLADKTGGPEDIGFGGARGGGKSACVMAQLIIDDCQRQENLKCLLLRKVGKAAKENFEDFLRKLFPGYIKNYIPSRSMMVFENGSRIIIGHFNAEKDIDAYLGLEYDIIAIEEATTLSKSKLEVIKTVLRTSKPKWRPRTYYTFNPGGVGHQHIKRLLYNDYIAEKEGKGKQTHTRFIPSTIDDNTFINKEYRRTLNNLTGWHKKAWRYGDMEIAAGQYFTTWNRHHHVIDYRDIPREGEIEKWVSLDYGFVHPTCMYLYFKVDGITYIVDESCESKKGVKLQAMNYYEMLKRNNTLNDDLWKVVAGSDVLNKGRDGRTVQDEYQTEGINLRLAKTGRIEGATNYLRLLGDFERGIDPRVYVSTRCNRLIETLPMCEHDPKNPEDVLKWNADEMGLDGDDPYDSSRYGLMEVNYSFDFGFG